MRAVPKVPVLIFSQHAEAIYATKALEAGAQGFVSKNAMPEEFLEAVDAVLGGGIAVEKSIQREMAMRDVVEDAYLKPLTERDIEILRLLAAGNNLTEIAAKLGIAYKTVANTLSRIKEKLGAGQNLGPDPHRYRPWADGSVLASLAYPPRDRHMPLDGRGCAAHRQKKIMRFGLGGQGAIDRGIEQIVLGRAAQRLTQIHRALLAQAGVQGAGAGQRTRLQLSQKLWLSGVMKPSRPPVSATRT